MDLPVLAEHHSRQVVAVDSEKGGRNGGGDPVRAFADIDPARPPAVLGDADSDAGSAEEARTRLGDQLQRVSRIARCIGDGSQDFGGGLLLQPRGFQLSLQPCGL